MKQKMHRYSGKRVLLIVPNLTRKRGVANYYNVILPKLRGEIDILQFGKDDEKKHRNRRLISFLREFWAFCQLLLNKKYDIVHLNPSFDVKSIIRDSFYIITAKFMGAKVLIFFQGWHSDFEKRLKKFGFFLFRWIYNKTDAFIVLSTQYMYKLREWGFKQIIFIETTVVDEELLKQFSVEEKILDYKRSKTKNILFLSRIVRKKGILIAINAVKLVATEKKNVALYICGTGNDLPVVIDASEKYKFIKYMGHVEGGKKREILTKSHIFIFPTLYDEGMPTVVIEAMAFGMPVLTRNVRGIADLLEKGMQGFVTESTNPRVFAEFIKIILEDHDLYTRMAKKNYEIATRYFLAGDAAQRLLRIYDEVCQDDGRK